MKDQGTLSCPAFSDCSDCINQLWNIIVRCNQKSLCTAVRYRGIHRATGSSHFSEVPDLCQSSRTLWTSCSWFVLLIVTVKCPNQAGWQRDAFTPARQLTVFTPPHFHGSVWFEEGSLPLVHAYRPSKHTSSHSTYPGRDHCCKNQFVCRFLHICDPQTVGLGLSSGVFSACCLPHRTRCRRSSCSMWPTSHPLVRKAQHGTVTISDIRKSKANQCCARVKLTAGCYWLSL